MTDAQLQAMLDRAGECGAKKALAAGGVGGSYNPGASGGSGGGGASFNLYANGALVSAVTRASTAPTATTMWLCGFASPIFSPTCCSKDAKP